VTEGDTWQRVDRFVGTRVGTGTVILDLEAGRYYSFEDTALVIWDLLEAPQSLASIVENLTGSYNVTHEQCQTDVAKFVNRLTQKSLVRLVS
jgi:hypothetical protein